MIVAIIPARGGSKRIPLKNVRPFAGKPMIQYSIDAALESDLFDRVIVSTDSDQIAQTARALGAEAPFARPAAISDDFTPTADVLLHALEWLNTHGPRVRQFCCIYPTAPFLLARFLKESFDQLLEKKAGGVFPVTTFPYPIFRALKVTDQGTVQMFWPEHELSRSNDLPRAYHDAGQFYWLDAESFLTERRLWVQRTYPYVLSRKYVQDIDTPEDWEVAEALFAAMSARS